MGDRGGVNMAKVLSPEKIQEIIEYHNKGLSLRAISKEVGTDREVISKYLKQNGFEISHSLGRQRACLGENQFIEITEPLREILEGNLLGDGSLIFTPSKLSAGYGHGSISLNHMEWLKEEFKLNGLPTSPMGIRPAEEKIMSGGINKGSKMNASELYQFRSVHIPILGEMKKRWYKPKKRVPADLVLTPRMLLHWYLGDGSRTEEKYRTRLTLYTNYFPLKDQEILVKGLSNLGIHSTITKSNKISGQGMRITITKDDVDKFISLVGPCPPELIADYGHKWPNQF